jgi:hypothetical protein
MRSLTSLRASRALVVAALVGAAFIVVVGASCQLIVPNTLPAPLFCLPDAGEMVCPGDQICQPNATGTQFTCVPTCTTDDDCLQVHGTCDPHGWCQTDGGLADGGNADGGWVAPADAMVDASTDAPIADGGPGGDEGQDGQVCGVFGCKCSPTAGGCGSPFACVDRRAVTLDVWSLWADAGDAGGGFCAAPCCTSFDCDPGDGGVGGTVCFASGAGGNYCIPPEWLGDREPLGPAASNLGGAACVPDAGQCRSGLCGAGACVDTCCSNFALTECANPGAVCRFGQFPGSGFDIHEAAHCDVTSSGEAQLVGGTACIPNQADQCRSDLCMPSGGMMGGPECRDACRVPDECAGTVGGRVTQGPPPQSSCEYVQPFPMSNDLATVCVPVPQQQGAAVNRGDAGAGSPCLNTSDCARGYCADGSCLIVCYADTPASTTGDCAEGERCRPQPLHLGDAGPLYSVLACGM